MKTRMNAFQPQLESLEDRALTAVSITTANGGSTLLIEGDANANLVKIIQNDTAGTIRVVANGSPLTLDATQINKVEVRLHFGDDNVRYRLARGTDFTRAKEIRLDPGFGNDKVTLRFDGGAGASTPARLNAALDITIPPSTYETGSDQVKAMFGQVAGLTSLYADLNGGDNVANVILAGQIEGAGDLRLHLQGSDGVDRFNVGNRHGHVPPGQEPPYSHIQAGGKLNVNLLGGFGNDELRFVYAARADGELKASLFGSNGADTLYTDLSFTPETAPSPARHRAVLDGGTGDDQLTLLANLLESYEIGYYWTGPTIDGGEGFDTYTASRGVSVRDAEVNLPPW